jgi:Ca2+-transporting ATPase
VTDMTTTDQRPDYVLTATAVLERSGVDAKVGLDAQEVAQRTQRYGPNKFAEAPPEPFWQRFTRQYQDLMQVPASCSSA